MTQTFNFPVTSRTGESTKFRVRAAQFGDGYRQTVADGLNVERKQYSVEFAGSLAEVNAVRDFLRARAGHESFYWTPPGEVQGYYQCQTYHRMPQGGDTWVLTADFEEVFHP